MAEETKQEKQVAFIDHIGRTIVGSVVVEDEKQITIDNPVVLHWQIREDKSIEVQTYPLFFMEFIDKAHRNTNHWKFQKDNIVMSDVVLDERISGQAGKVNTPEPKQEESPKIISIDDL